MEVRIGERQTGKTTWLIDNLMKIVVTSILDNRPVGHMFVQAPTHSMLKYLRTRIDQELYSPRVFVYHSSDRFTIRTKMDDNIYFITSGNEVFPSPDGEVGIKYKGMAIRDPNDHYVFSDECHMSNTPDSQRILLSTRGFYTGMPDLNLNIFKYHAYRYRNNESYSIRL